MKRTILSFCSVNIIFFLISCGPSAETIKREMKQKMEAKLALQDSVKKTKNLKLDYEHAITTAKGDLEVAKDRLLRIKEFQFGRTTDEREQQIKNQTMEIGKIEEHINKLQNSIPEIENKVAYFEAQLNSIEQQINK